MLTIPTMMIIYCQPNSIRPIFYLHSEYSQSFVIIFVQESPKQFYLAKILKTLIPLTIFISPVHTQIFYP